MKIIGKNIRIIMALLAVAAIYGSCTKGPDIKTYTYPAPLPQGLTPNIGYAGTDVVITGSSFGDYKNVVKVFFNGIEADSIISCEDGKIVARVPGDGISGKVSLQVWDHIVDSIGNYTVLPSPVADSISRLAGLAGDTVIIMGKNFGGDLSKVKVSFNGPTGTLTEVTDTTITAIVPTGFTAGNITVTVNDFSVQGPLFGALATLADTVYWLQFEGNLTDKMGGTAATYTFKDWGKPMSYDNGISGQAAVLPGASNIPSTNNQVLALPAQITKHKELTVSAWVNWSNDSGWVQEPIFDAGQARGARLCLMTQMNSSFGSGYKNMIGRLVFEKVGSYTSITYYNAIANQPLPTPSWHHVAMVISYSQLYEKIYMDGVEVGSIGLVSTADPTVFNHNKVYIGSPTNGVVKEPAFGGMIDDFKVFDYAMTPEQVFTDFYHAKM
jgi:hypothetical protein